MIDREKALDRVRKLLNHAKGAGHFSEAEVETYLRHARKLMDEFNIAEADIVDENSDVSKSAYDSIKKESAYRRAHLDRFMVDLAWTPAVITDTQFYINFRSDGEHVTYYGLPRDVAVACELYKELLVTMRTMCKVRYGEARPKEYKDYCLGFAWRIRQRAQEVKKQSSQTAGTTAIVLAKDVLVGRWASNNLKLRKRKSSGGRIGDSDAFSNGVGDGNNVSLETNQLRNEPQTESKQLS